MSDPAVDPEEVRHVADLARVDLADDEIERFTEQLGDILDAFEALDDVPETEREAELSNVMRPDETRESSHRRKRSGTPATPRKGSSKGRRCRR